MTELKIGPPPFPNRVEYPFTASVRYRGMIIDIENLDGSVRKGKGPNGHTWSTNFNGCHYGELRGSLGTDGDKLDVYIKSKPMDGANKAYIVHQNFPRTHPTKAGQYDEDKVILGVSSAEKAKELYLQHYNRKDFFRSVTEMSIEAFKRYARGENKGEKMAHWSEKSIKAYDKEVAAARKRGEPSLNDLEKAYAASGNSSSVFASQFIRQKMREGPMKKTALDEAYEAGVRQALNEYLKTAYIGSGAKAIKVPKQPASFMKVLKKLPESPVTVGKISPPPKVGT